MEDWIDETWLDEQVEDALWVLDQCLGDGIKPFVSFRVKLRETLINGNEEERWQRQQAYLSAREEGVQNGTPLKDMKKARAIIKDHTYRCKKTERTVQDRADTVEIDGMVYYRDAYDHEPILPDPKKPQRRSYAFGHKFGHEDRRYVLWAETIGLSQKEFKGMMDNPDLFQIENASLNSGSTRENTSNEPWRTDENGEQNDPEEQRQGYNRFFANLVEQYNQRRDERFRDWEEEYSR